MVFIQRSLFSSFLHVLALAALVVFTTGCAGGASAQSDSAPPDWFLNPDDVYNEARYLMATASGPSSQAAQDEAFGNLARIFEADIDATQELKDDYQEVKEGGDVTETQQETRLITRSDIRANQELLNSEVLEQASVDDTYYALVGMERRETVSIYSEEIESNRSLIEDYRERGETAENPVTRLAFLRKALVLAKVNDRLITQRNIVAGGSAPSMSDASPVAALEEAVRSAQRECPVVIRVENEDTPSSIRDQVGATLETAGFRVVDRADDAILDALIKYQERPALESRDEEFLRWTLAIELSDQTLRQTLETFTTEKRAGGMSEAGVRRKAHNAARTVVEEDFSTFLEETLLNIDP